MEASDCVHDGYFRSGSGPPQFTTQEKRNGPGDRFTVEDLLDFSNEEEDNVTNGGDDGLFETATGNSTDSSTVTTVGSCNSSLSGGDCQFPGELCEPYDELAELEWLSNLVEDSFSSEDLQKLQLISGVIKPNSGSGSGNGSGSDSSSSSSATRPVENPTNPTQFFLPEASPFPAKARSKRSRAAANRWSSQLLVIPPPDSDTDSLLLDPNPVRKTPKPAKKREPGLLVPDGRKCLHCATDKTPQWRTGPMGPKTLCNACGVRYKSGRLVPEYRPASSPTFVLWKHSNSHRKVMELRRQKEVQVGFEFDGGSEGMMGDEDDDGCLIHHHLGPQTL